MKRATFAIALVGLLVGVSAQAQMQEDPTCYNWNGGNFSAGSFSKCRQPWVAAPKPAPVAAPLPPPVAQSPVMMPMSSPVPPPKPIIKKKPKPRPKMICKPA